MFAAALTFGIIKADNRRDPSGIGKTGEEESYIKKMETTCLAEMVFNWRGVLSSLQGLFNVSADATYERKQGEKQWLPIRLGWQ